MMFRRRKPLSLAERAKLWFWPQGGWGRAMRYFAKRVLRLSASPHAIAIGFAIGVFASFTPFVGLHVLMSLVVAFLLGGNMASAAIGTVIGNPLTFPLIWLSTYEVGVIALGEAEGQVGAPDLQISWASQPVSALLPLIEPMAVGSLILGGIFATIAYLIVRWSVFLYQKARRHRLMARRQAENGKEWKAA